VQGQQITPNPSRNAKKRLFRVFQKPTHGNNAPMNTSIEMNHEEVQRVRLEVLRREHRDLDEAISALEEVRRGDQLTIRRLKTQKLRLKDQIAAIKDDLTPDIIA
jgi:hypothetical protein